jgi:chaperonin GroEL (HSP60 family)
LGVREGLDASTGVYGDLFAARVFDPVLVTRAAPLNAASIAKTILTTECIVSGPAALSPSGAEVSGLGRVRTRLSCDRRSIRRR